MTPLYLIFAGNLGLVWNGSDESEAHRQYDIWCDKVNAFGRAHGEGVILMRDEETILEQA